MIDSLFQIITFIGLTVTQEENAVRKGIPHNLADLPLLASIEASGVCIPVGNSEVLLTAVK
jgi:hypothetical protein